MAKFERFNSFGELQSEIRRRARQERIERQEHIKQAQIDRAYQLRERGFKTPRWDKAGITAISKALR